MATTSLNFKTAPGHQVLAAAGKKILRPGGKAATEKLFEYAHFQPGETVLELASSFGYSAISLAQRFGVKVTGIEKNYDSITQSRLNIVAAGLSDQINILEGDIFHLDNLINQPFDYVFAEAILTMQSLPGKTKLLQGIRQCLKPGGKYLSQEMMAISQAEEIRQALSPTIHANTTPLSLEEWMNSCENASLKIGQYQIRSMGLLNPKQVIEDEGLLNTIRIAWNVITHSEIRERVLEMHQVLNQYRDLLKVIVFCAVAE